MQFRNCTEITEIRLTIQISSCKPIMHLLPSAAKLRRLCFYTCLSVILFMGGVCPIACWDTLPGSEADIPLSRHPPWGTPPQADTPRVRGRPPGQMATAADGTHHIGMNSCFYYGLFGYLNTVKDFSIWVGDDRLNSLQIKDCSYQKIRITFFWPISTKKFNF